MGADVVMLQYNDLSAEIEFQNPPDHSKLPVAVTVLESNYFAISSRKTDK